LRFLEEWCSIETKGIANSRSSGQGEAGVPSQFPIGGDAERQVHEPQMRLSRRKTGTDGTVRMGEGHKLASDACRSLDTVEIKALRSIAQGFTILLKAAYIVPVSKFFRSSTQ